MDCSALITYGSLLAFDELTDVFADPETYPIRVSGYQRHFAQEAMVRTGADGERGVLTVEPDSESWFNGLLVTGFTADEYEAYVSRESGYHLTMVDSSALTFYEESPTEDVLSDVRVPIGDEPLTDPTPIPAYANLCVSGAAEHGPQFLTDFLVTTTRC